MKHKHIIQSKESLKFYVGKKNDDLGETIPDHEINESDYRLSSEDRYFCYFILKHGK